MSIPARVGRLVSSVTAHRDPITVELLVRPGCHLCEDAERELRPVFGRRNIRVRDILEHRELEDEFVFRIPVVRYRRVVLVEGLITADEARAARARALALRSSTNGS